MMKPMAAVVAKKSKFQIMLAPRFRKTQLAALPSMCGSVLPIFGSLAIRLLRPSVR
jgi:hypothetical protein